MRDRSEIFEEIEKIREKVSKNIKELGDLKGEQAISGKEDPQTTKKINDLLKETSLLFDKLLELQSEYSQSKPSAEETSTNKLKLKGGKVFSSRIYLLNQDEREITNLGDIKLLREFLRISRTHLIENDSVNEKIKNILMEIYRILKSEKNFQFTEEEKFELAEIEQDINSIDNNEQIISLLRRAIQIYIQYYRYVTEKNEPLLQDLNNKLIELGQESIYNEEITIIRNLNFHLNQIEKKQAQLIDKLQTSIKNGDFEINEGFNYGLKSNYLKEIKNLTEEYGEWDNELNEAEEKGYELWGGFIDLAVAVGLDNMDKLYYSLFDVEFNFLEKAFKTHIQEFKDKKINKEELEKYIDQIEEKYVEWQDNINSIYQENEKAEKILEKYEKKLKKIRKEIENLEKKEGFKSRSNFLEKITITTTTIKELNEEYDKIIESIKVLKSIALAYSNTEMESEKYKIISEFLEEKLRIVSQIKSLLNYVVDNPKSSLEVREIVIELMEKLEKVDQLLQLQYSVEMTNKIGNKAWRKSINFSKREKVKSDSLINK